uniref:testis-expressed protein 45 isoform X1 n=1 Tax=Oncorhynchus gorbuscha TaxID=8017 RepID=UPI001EAF2A18|nr:testis-expressed protein 45 isoform X1 [Oncorhynchus gorbuscha]XP_046158757.1 testis-expressed protein 45 isoform X1 [Oncorhynchus gorbuscha]XP_046158764.1 testis-expressed protein 45 isoform X1 [Oncorhynchus gorbuscha]XP_046158775.1 testis-expressed protein 45 isoform X1 [Oncorhynchus gorbuscha]
MAVSTLIQATLMGKDFLQSSHIPFWGGDSCNGLGEAFKTTFQTDFNSLATLPKRFAISRPIPAQVEHKDLRRIKEYLTEAVKSYTHHPQIPLCRTPAWAKLCTNFQMHKDPRQVNFLTTQAEGFQQLASTHTKPIRPVMAIKKKQLEEKLPVTTHKASFTPYNVSPIVKAKVKHLGREPTFKWDRDGQHFDSHHNNVFQGQWHSPPQPVEKQIHSSVAMGDPQKILETKTTQDVSFGHPGNPSPVNVKERLKVNLGDFSENKWTSTMADAFREAKSAPVPLMQMNKTLSSVPRGDTDPGRNRRRMMATTNSFFFSEQNHRERPVHVSGANVRTRSNVEFGRPILGGLFYSTAAQEDYPKRDINRARPHTHPSGHVLTGQEPGTASTTVQRDYLPLNSRRQELSPKQLQQIKFSHITAPYNEQHFTTTHKEAFGPKPLSRTCPDNPPRQHISHMPF